MPAALRQLRLALLILALAFAVIAVPHAVGDTTVNYENSFQRGKRAAEEREEIEQMPLVNHPIPQFEADVLCELLNDGSLQSTDSLNSSHIPRDCTYWARWPCNVTGPNWCQTTYNKLLNGSLEAEMRCSSSALNISAPPWGYVHCDPDTLDANGTLRVTALKFQHENSNITISPNISKFTKLRHLTFGSNGSWVAPFPQVIGSLGSLLELSFGDVRFTGTFPSFINLTKLALLRLDDLSSMSSTPLPVFSSANLQTVSYERVPNLVPPNGSLPGWLKYLPKLTKLEYGENAVALPLDLGDLKSLVEFEADLSYFAYAAMDFTPICGLTNLTILSMDGARRPVGRTGSPTLPDCFSKLTKLRYMQLGRTNYSGTIPESFSKLKSLGDVELDSASLVGCNQFVLNQTAPSYYCGLWSSRFYCYCSGIVRCNISSCINVSIPPGATYVPGIGLVYNNLTVAVSETIVLNSSVAIAPSSQLILPSLATLSIRGDLLLNQSSASLASTSEIIVSGDLVLVSATVTLDPSTSLQIGGCLIGNQSELTLVPSSSLSLVNGSNRIPINITYLGDNCSLPTFTRITLEDSNVCVIHSAQTEPGSGGTIVVLFDIGIRPPGGSCSSSPIGPSGPEPSSPIPGLNQAAFLAVVIVVPIVIVILIVAIILFAVRPIRQKVFPFKNREKFETKLKN